MPEGHTIHRLAAQHRELLAGHRVIASSPQGRFVAGAARIDGAEMVTADARGKHLLHSYRRTDGTELTLHVHLGLYGKFGHGRTPAPAPAGALRLRLATTKDWLDLRGPTVCELLEPPEVAVLVARIGADPLRPDADQRRAGARIAASRAPIGALLMDQSVVAGVGNIYRAESLFRAGVNPYRPGREVDAVTWLALWRDLRGLLQRGVRAGRIETLRTGDRRAARAAGTRFYVYKRSGQACLRCGTPVMAAVMVARTLFWCPTCQPG